MLMCIMAHSPTVQKYCVTKWNITNLPPRKCHLPLKSLAHFFGAVSEINISGWKPSGSPFSTSQPESHQYVQFIHRILWNYHSNSVNGKRFPGVDYIYRSRVSREIQMYRCGQSYTLSIPKDVDDFPQSLFKLFPWIPDSINEMLVNAKKRNLWIKKSILKSPPRVY